uniref:Uncharacterized protein n=1 Tax=Amphimedon queenslandica TaxID=400682 RepID=A0A1X7U2I6_AMPQE
MKETKDSGASVALNKCSVKRSAFKAKVIHLDPLVKVNFQKPLTKQDCMILLGIRLTILAMYVSDKLRKILSITNLLFLEKLWPSYDKHHKCPVCDWKVSMAVPQDIVKCSNCSAKFKVPKAKKQSMAKLQIKDNNGEVHKMTMFTQFLSTLLNIAQRSETIEEYLLSMDNIKV